MTHKINLVAQSWVIFANLLMSFVAFIFLVEGTLFSASLTHKIDFMSELKSDQLEY